MTYQVWMVRYDGKEKFSVGLAIRTLDKARAIAFKSVAHTGFNARGEYKCKIYEVLNGSLAEVGEVMNDAFDERRWYPNRKVSTAKYRKYKLYKDGTTGKGLSW